MALTKTQTREVTITPSGAALGADVSDFDISEIDAAGIEVIRKAWLDYLVLRVRGQDFGDAEHTRFAKLLEERVRFKDFLTSNTLHLPIGPVQLDHFLL